jgi:hypothetical protein
MAYLDAAAGAAREGATGELPTLLTALPVAAIVDLVAASGTADGTVADVTSSFSQTILNNNFQDIATKVNAILAGLRIGKVVAP